MIVVDTNIIAYMVFPGDYTDAVVSLHEADPQWEAPLLWKSEFLNVVSIYFRKNYISYMEVLDALDHGQRLIGNRTHFPSPYAAMEFIQNSSCSAYDCEFLALADHLKVNLITYDKQILNAFPEIAVRPEDYVAKNIR